MLRGKHTEKVIRTLENNALSQYNHLARFSTAVQADSSTIGATTRTRTTTGGGGDHHQQQVKTPRAPPSPALPLGFKAKFLGHVAFMKEDKNARESAFHRLVHMKTQWYKETNSKTILLNMVGSPLVFCADPAVYREILGEKQGSFTNSNGFRDTFGYMFPKSMIVLEGSDWQRVRRVSQKALNKMDMDRVIGGVVEVLESGIKHNGLGKNAEDVDTFKFLSHLTFDVFHKVMYSFDPETITNDPSNPHVKLLHACEGLLSGVRQRVFTRHMKFLWGLPLSKNRKLNRDRDYIVSVGKKIAAERREALKSESAYKDGKIRSLLDGLLVSQDEEILSDKEVSDQIATFFFGAYETTSNTLLFTLNSLAENPRVQSKLREELKKRFPNGKADIAKATLADLDSVEYLLWTVDESFRLNSTANGIPRDVISDVVVGGYALKKGTSVSIDHWSVSRDPQFYGNQTDLNEFNPDRYGTHPLTDKLLSIPFGFGSRICPGRRIAIAETKAIISILTAEYEILPCLDNSKKLIFDTKLGLTCVEGTGFLRFRKL